MTSQDRYLPLAPDIPMGEYEVLFDGGTTGKARKTKTSWMITEDSAQRPVESGVVGYKKPWKPPQRDKILEEKMRMRK